MSPLVPSYREAYIDTCAAEGGVIETITVKAGTFEACKKHYVTPDVETTMWIGKVSPIGTIRSDLKKAEVLTHEELTDYVP